MAGRVFVAALVVASAGALAVPAALLVASAGALAVPARLGGSRAAVSMLAKKSGGGKGKGGSLAQKDAKAAKQAANSRSFDEATRSFMFTLLHVTKSLPDGSRTLLKDINLCFFPGAKIGVVGLNGSGKSSLLKIMAGVDTEFDGTARPMDGISIGYLAQEPELKGETVQDCMRAAMADGQALLDRFTDLSAKLSEPLEPDEMQAVMDETARVQDKIEAGNLWELERVMERAMVALRCPPNDAKTAVLSGGERRRVALAALLIQGHDLLLLDEPTNHLDAASVQWLETFLSTFTGTVVAITHDRYFLDQVCKWILELDRGEGVPFEGNYSGWLAKKAAQLAQEKREDSALARTLQNELDFISQTPKGRSAVSKARLRRYDELANMPARERLAHSTQIYLPPGKRLGELVIKAEGVRKTFGERVLIDNLSFDLPRAGIVGVVGPNGAGKSTLLRMILGLEQPDAGTMRIGETVNVVCVGQDREGLNEENSVFLEITDNNSEIELGTQSVLSRAYCSWFGFRGTDQQKLVRNLSGGERNRVQLAKLVRSGANLLLLDEPTNDLDVDTIRSLEEAILDFAGCAVVVSHDRYFLDRVATHILAFEGDSKVTFFEGNYAEYEEDYVARVGIEGSQPKPLKFAALA